jgi:hypothetical protein
LTRFYLLFNLHSKTDNFPSRATGVLRACEQHFRGIRVLQKPLDIYSVIDHAAIYRATNDLCQTILKEDGTDSNRYFVFLSPGTPPMHFLSRRSPTRRAQHSGEMIWSIASAT